MRKNKTPATDKPKVVDMIKPNPKVPTVTDDNGAIVLTDLNEALLRASYMELVATVNDFARIEENYMRQFEAKPEVAAFRQKIKSLDDQFNMLVGQYMEEVGVSPETHAYNPNERRFDPRTN